MDNKVVLADLSVKAFKSQAEKLLPLLDKSLKKNGFSLSDIESIIVESSGPGFTSLRIGVVTANALGYALGIPVKPSHGKALKINDFSLVKPGYDRPPSVTLKRRA